MADSTEIAVRNRADTQKSITLDRSQYTSSTAPPPPPRSHPVQAGMSDSSGGGGNRTFITVPQNKTAPVQGLPAFLGTQRTILFAWAIAMIVICADEWKAYHILPRPARLWWTTLVYAILALLSQVTALIPVTNALALGYSIVLVIQFFNKQGQFSSE